VLIMSRINIPHDEFVGSHAAPACVSISVLNQNEAGVTITLPVDVLRQLDAEKALNKPSYDAQKVELFKTFRRYLRRPSEKHGMELAVRGYHALCTILPDIPASLSQVIGECGSAWISILVSPRKRVLVGTISETAPDTKTLSKILAAAKRTPMRGGYNASKGWSSL